MSTKEVWMIAMLSVIVILSACFNYTNLSIARATRRSREIGIRKVVGASKGHVLGQFVVEAIIISLLALVLSLVLFVLLKPYFLSLQPTIGRMLDLNLSPKVVLYFIAFAACVGIVAGLLPALVFSRINAIQVLKNSSSLRLISHLNLRKALIVLQYSISLAFIAGTIIGFKQYQFLVNFDLGYDIENIVNIYLHGNEKRAEQLANELRKIPEVQGVSQSLIVTSIGNYWETPVKYKDPMDSANMHYNGVDENYIPLHNIRLIAGRNFTPLPDSAVESEVIVNEEVLKRFKIADGDPLHAIDEILIVNHKPLKIVGVLKDFHYGMADIAKSGAIFRYHKNSGNFVNVKVVTSDWQGTFEKIESVWKAFDDVHPIDAQLYADGIARSYEVTFGMLKLLGFLAFLAICIASLGLLGMVIFIAETRLKEISIRKVLGASERGLIYLLSKGFFFLLVISGAVALPATYIIFDRVVLVEQQNRVTINLIDLLAGFAGVLAVAFVLIGSQTIKIARKNPAEVLKNE
jgi:ABC-type antimicrobial peptide transport system permease subunit